jgi:MFS family permease
MICGGLSCTVAIFASSFAPNIYFLILTYGIGLGFGSSLIAFAAFQIVPLYFDRHHSLATAMVAAGPGAGLLLMSPVVEKLLEHFDWRKALMVLSAANLAPCILGYSIRRRKITRVENEEVLRQNNMSNRCFKRMKLIDTSALKNPMFLLLCLTTSFRDIGYTIPTIHLVSCSNVSFVLGIVRFKLILYEVEH